MKVTFLGTSGAVPTTVRNPSGLLVEREGDRLLFDCGEGTQRQMMRYGTGFDIEHIFLTHMHGDHIFGLPGLTQTWDFQDREKPLAIHAPTGTRSRVEQLLSATGQSPSYPIRVTQVSAGDVVLDCEEYEVRAIQNNHRTNAVGYALVEDDRKGEFDREKAEKELGIPPGPKYSKLHDGTAIEHDGRTIQPEEVVGSPRTGRRLVYTGDTRPTDGIVDASTDADLLVHDGTFGKEHRERALNTAHSTAREAAQVADDAGVKRLALTHISTRYTGRVAELESEAAERFDGTLFVADDGMQVTVPYPDSDREFAIERLD
ncbi:ribonuclease Z [Halovenus rubra]|uniref:Ribonuclease Z n=2 Tax=Halovenus rubra TaxID=869890 RepID=A0ABD5X5J2_9EURY|nr:ribonuclease Z [Halovenus rubra]